MADDLVMYQNSTVCADEICNVSEVYDDIGLTKANYYFNLHMKYFKKQVQYVNSPRL
jgi:hypothetical protein